ncbi:MAG: hypothetical protein ACLGXA_10665 [Acidobacteriota bacterium]
MSPRKQHPNPHARLDAIAWRTIHDRKRPRGVPTPPRNFGELPPCEGPEFSESLNAFLDRFYWWKRPEALQIEPPLGFAPEYRAFLAAVAEFLCHEFTIQVPAWVAEPGYCLKVEWDAAADLEEVPWVLVIPIEERRAKAAPEFLSRNIIFPSRGLICV